MRTFFEYLRLTLLKFFNISTGNKIKLAGYTIHYGNIKNLKLLYKEIFIKENYKCELDDNPFIIDGGANIGLAVLYLKLHHPNAIIKAFEPNRESFDFLKLNIEANNIKGVELYNKALSDKTGTLTFYTSTDMQIADASASTVKKHVIGYHGTKGKLEEVAIQSERLSLIIDQKVDLLKLDIEGSEGQVFKDLGEKFDLIENSIMEYHYQSNNPENKLSDILNIIESNNHEYHISSISKSNEIKDLNCYMLKSRRGVRQNAS